MNKKDSQKEFDFSSFYNLASYKSFWRWYWYYKNGNVKLWNQVSEYEYDGIVRSDSGNEYSIHLNLEKPKSSKCNCPFANGKHIICKHMVALYFEIFPIEAVEFDKKVYEFEDRQAKKQEQREKQFNEYKKELSSWSREKLENYVANVMLEDYYRFDGEDDDCDIYY